MYTLGDSSRQLMQSLDQDVTVYYLCETGSEDAIITKLLDHYADESGHFHWEQKDRRFTRPLQRSTAQRMHPPAV